MLPDPIAAAKPSGKIIKRLADMKRRQEDAERNV